MKCSLCGVIGHNKRGCKNAPKQQQHSNNHATAEQTTPQQQHPRTSSAIPMHNRGVGIYTYPNGYQRIATPISQHFPTPQRQRPPAAFYSDHGGEQTIYSFPAHDFPLSQTQPSQGHTISSQALQDLAMARRLEKRP
ncbi:uncharacterized protein [Spinacia oleracea]|nr:uncharacterized protein LOC130464214 [Spinacia oleracea]